MCFFFFLPNMGSCLPLFLQTLFFHSTFSSTFGTSVTPIVDFLVYSRLYWVLFIFFSLCCLDLVIYIDLSSGSLIIFFHHLHFFGPYIEFILDIVILWFWNFHFVLHISVSLLRLSIFPFFWRVSILFSWIILIIAAL